MKLIKIDRNNVSYSLIFSLFLHVGFFTIIVQKIQTDKLIVHAPVIVKNPKNLTIRLDEIQVISKKKLQQIKDNNNRQIVATETNGKKGRPDNSRFLGENDQVVERQTMAMTNGSFKEAGQGKKEGAPSSLAQPKSVINTIAKSTLKKTIKDLSLTDLGSFKVSDLEKIVKENEESLDVAAKKLDSEKISEALGIERGKIETNGLAQNNDFIEDVPLGDMTNLNTTEFKYYGFYHRIKQKLEQHWGSSIKDKAKNLYRSGRRMPASENLITSITVTLDGHGQIVDMQIEGTSGIRELDQAAIESFNKAGPFPNPPKGLLIGGRATIQWGFVVKS